MQLRGQLPDSRSLRGILLINRNKGQRSGFSATIAEMPVNAECATAGNPCRLSRAFKHKAELDGWFIQRSDVGLCNCRVHGVRRPGSVRGIPGGLHDDASAPPGDAGQGTGGSGDYLIETYPYRPW